MMGGNGQVTIWDVAASLTTKEGQMLTSFQPQNDQEPTRILFNGAGTEVAISYSEGLVELWTLAELDGPRLTLTGHTNNIGDLEFNQDETLLAAAARDGEAIVWDTATGDELFKLTGHAGSVTDITFSPDGSRLATASADGTAAYGMLDWNLAAMLRRLLSHYSI